jgi:predicted nucleic acid-binding protein
MNTSYLGDTDWAIDYLNGQERTLRRLEELRNGGLAFSMISLAEVYEGILYSKDPEKNERGLQDFLQYVTVVNIDEKTSWLFGEERGRLRSEGRRVADFDLMIAVTARQHDLTLLTNNRKHFEHIEGLRIETLSE